MRHITSNGDWYDPNYLLGGNLEDMLAEERIQEAISQANGLGEQAEIQTS